MKNYLDRVWWTLILFVASSGCFAQAPTQTLNVSGLREAVTVRRDGRGIPYIEAKTEADLYFAQGFVTAQDRLWQMDLLRRVALGETAEIFGRARFEEDKMWRKYGFRQIAADAYKLSAPESRRALDDYARGVNAYLAALDAKNLPAEFQILQYRPREWQPTDSLAVGKILSEGLSSTWRQDLIKALIPPDKRAEMFEQTSNFDVLLFGADAKTKTARFDKGVEENNLDDAARASILDALKKSENVRKSSLAGVGFYAEDLAASNNWVISGKKTADGKPLLANDPHLDATQPPVWYLAHLAAPSVKTAGVSLPGIPGVVLGHNENIAWGATNVGPDVQDLYLVEFDAANPLQYRTPNGLEIAQTRREEIKVRKNPLSAETEIVPLDVVTTRDGVIFFEQAGKRYALKWTALDAKNSELDGFYFLNRAKNWNDFRAALKLYGGATQNFVYADRQGNIGWYAAGKIPLRRTGDGSLPYDGKTSDGDWTGFIPFEELPNLYNPPENFIVTANQRTVGKSYKYHDVYARVFTPFRAARLQQLIAANSKITIKDVGDFQFDIYSILNALFAKEIVNQKAASDETVKLLSDWDGRMNADSRAALLVNEMRGAFRNRILSAAFGAEQSKNISWANEGNFFEKVLRTKPKNWLPKEFANYADLLKACERDARENLTKRLGADAGQWTWGAANKIRFNHPLAIAPLVGAQFTIAPLPLNGAGTSPNVGASVSMRLIAAPGDWDQTRHAITTGESGNPNSPHWKDQLENWYAGNTPVFPFSKSAIEKAAKETILLVPQK